MDSNATQLRQLDDAALRGWPLPQPAPDGDKHERGSVLVIAGSREMPGAAVLAATAALRAGAGKLAVATAASVAPFVAIAVPEARVIGLRETAHGSPHAQAAADLAEAKLRIDAVVIGPGMQHEHGVVSFVAALWPKLAGAKIILDALAINAVHDLDRTSDDCASLLLTPHAGEMAHLMRADKNDVRAEASAAARSAAQRFNALVALKGASTFIAVPGHHIWEHKGGNIGLASSGSGDVLAGLIAGLAARGAALEQAAAWGVALHARAGEVLAARLGRLGYLSRELAGEVPALMEAARTVD